MRARHREAGTGKFTITGTQQGCCAISAVALPGCGTPGAAIHLRSHASPRASSPARPAPQRRLLGTRGAGSAARRPRPRRAVANLHCARRQRIVIAPSRPSQQPKIEHPYVARVPRSSLADAGCTRCARAGADARVAEQAGPHFGAGYRRERDRSGLPHGLRSGLAAGGTTLHHRQPRRRRRNAGPCRGRQGRPRRLYAALPLALADDLPGDPQHAALRYRA